MPIPENNNAQSTPLGDDVAKLRAELEELRATQAVRNEMIDKHFDFASKLEKIRDTNEQRWANLNRWKLIGPVILVVVGFFGYKITYNGLKDSISQAVEPQIRSYLRIKIDTEKSFFSDLVNGSILISQDKYDEARVPLARGFNLHPDEESVVGPYIEDMLFMDDVDSAAAIIAKIKKSESANGFKDPNNYYYLGRYEIATGEQRYLDSGLADLYRGHERNVSNAYFYQGCVEYWISKGNLEEASVSMDMVDSDSQFLNIWSWDEIKSKHWMKVFFRRFPQKEKELEPLWTNLYAFDVKRPHS